MTKPPRIQAIEVVGPTQLCIAWSTGERLEVDLAEPINRRQALAPLCDPAVFWRVQVGEWGHSLVWDGEIDLGADRLYERCKEQGSKRVTFTAISLIGRGHDPFALRQRQYKRLLPWQRNLNISDSVA